MLFVLPAIICFGQSGDLIHGTYLGVSQPLSKTSNPPGKDAKADLGQEEKIKKNFEGREKPRLIHRNVRKKKDPLHDPQAAYRINDRFPEMLTDGMGYTLVQPPDPSGAVGNGIYFQMINGGISSFYQILDSLGIPITGVTAANSFWTQFGKTGLGDPIILFDKGADRWFVSEFAVQGSTLLLAVSTSSDPLGTYHAYQFTTPNFPDYPKYGAWHNAYYCTTNESGPSVVYAFERDSILVGAPARIVRFTVPDLLAFGFQSLTPVHWDGGVEPDTSLPATVWRHIDDEAHFPTTNDTTKDFVEYWEVYPDFDSVANSSIQGPFTIDVTEFDSDINGYTAFSGIVQPHPFVKLDPLREVFMQKLQFRSFSGYDVLLGCHVTDIDGNDWAGMRWYEFRKTDTIPWYLYQEGTFAPDSANRWMGSISMDRDQNIAMAYNVASSEIFPSLRYTGRLATDPLGQMTMLEQEISTGFDVNLSNRYGDYNSISLDTDEETFWFTGQFNPTRNWGTGIAKFKISYECSDLYARVVKLRRLVCQDSSNGSLTIRGSGGFSAYEYSLDNINYSTDSVFDQLAPGIYRLFIRDADSNQCVVSIPAIKIETQSALNISTTENHPSSPTSQDGFVIINANPWAPGYLYSLDGVNFQASSVFTGLGVGSYGVTVIDTLGCIHKDSFELSPANGLLGHNFAELTLYPNPSSGIAFLEWESALALAYLIVFDLNAKEQWTRIDVKGKTRKDLVLEKGEYFVTGFDHKGNRVFAEKLLIRR